jgi:transposase
MIIAPGYIGIDICKTHLDIHDGSDHRIENTAAGIATFLCGLREPHLVLFEATGRYDLELRNGLSRAGIAFVRTNPARARNFARSVGQLAKTDRLDARMLAAMAQMLQPAPAEPIAPEREDLADLHRRRTQLVEVRQGERTRRHTASPAILPSINDHIAYLDKQIDQLDSQIGERIKASAALSTAAKLLRSIPGIGPVATTALLALLPELGQRPGKTIAALCGLAPINRDSGAWRGKRCIGGGRHEVRKALYMAAVTASRSNPRLAATYKALIERNKPPKLALVAIARKLSLIANAILRSQTPFKA